MLPKIDNANLLVVDIQEKLAAAMPARHLQGNLTRAAKLTIAARETDIPILLTEQYPRGLGHTLPAIAGEIPENTPLIEKNEFNALDNPQIAAHLESLWDQRPLTILVGLETHICILQTALAIAAQQQPVWVVEDACISRYDEDHKSAIALLRQQGIAVASFETVLFSLIGEAATPAFKALSHLGRERDY